MHSNVTIKNVSWLHFSWVTLYKSIHSLVYVSECCTVLCGVSCPAENDIALILEFQTALRERDTPVTRAWCRVSVFNDSGWIRAGCWRLPLIHPPVDLLPSAPEAFTRKVNRICISGGIKNRTNIDMDSLLSVLCAVKIFQSYAHFDHRSF